MTLAQAIDDLDADLEPGLTQQLVGEEAAAHADLAMDAPDRKLDAFGVERLLPGEHMLINAVDQRAVEIKQKGVLGAHGVPRVPAAVQRAALAERCTAEPGPSQAPAFVMIPGLQRNASRCARDTRNTTPTAPSWRGGRLRPSRRAWPR